MASRLLSRRFPAEPGVRNLRLSGFTNQISLILESVARGLGFTVIPRFARLAFSRQDAIQVIEGVPSCCRYAMVAAPGGMAIVGSRSTGLDSSSSLTFDDPVCKNCSADKAAEWIFTGANSGRSGLSACRQLYDRHVPFGGTTDRSGQEPPRHVHLTRVPGHRYSQPRPIPSD